MTTYFVKNGGDDGLDGLSDANAWATVAKVNGSTFAAGDVVQFNRGDTWREQLTMPSAGSAGNPITIGAYGTGDIPRFLGSTAITTWTNNTIPAFSADLLSETFDPAGYDNVWTETVGSGSTLDEDSTAIADPLGGSSQILKIQKVSPNWAAWATIDLGADKPISYTQFYVNVTAEGLGNSQELSLFHAKDTAGNTMLALTLRQNSGGALTLHMKYWSAGAQVASTEFVISLSTWYKVELKYDKTNMLWEFRVNGNSIASGSLTATASNGIRHIRVGSLATDAFTVTAYLETLKISSTGYYSPGGNGNTWKAAYTATPAGLWFVDGDGTVHSGNKVASDAAATSLYDWFTDGVNAYVNSGGTTAGFDPDTLFASVEASVRTAGVFNQSKAYVTIQDIEARFCETAGFYLYRLAANAIIQRCTGAYNALAGIESAFGGAGNEAPVDVTITKCIARYNGNVGIDVQNFTRRWTVTSNTVDHNGIDLTQTNPGGIKLFGQSSGGHEVAYNTVYANGNSSLNGHYGALWVDTVNENAVEAQSVNCHDNTCYDNLESGIFIEKTSDGDFHHNRCYSNANGTTSVAGIWLDAFISTHVASRNRILHNTCYGNYIGLALQADSSVANQLEDNLVQNNAVSGNTLRQLDCSVGANNDGTFGSGNVYTYNCFGAEASNFIKWGATSYSTYATWNAAAGAGAGVTDNYVNGDPVFVNAPSDLRLQSGSPCKDAGVVIAGINDGTGGSTRYNNNAPDIGAFEATATNFYWIKQHHVKPLMADSTTN